MIFELFNDTAPKTSENFRALCTGEKGMAPTGHPLYYKGTHVHRVIKDFMIQGGDIVKGNGAGSPESIYSGPFEDEDLERPVDEEGLLCMANKGPNTNGSQYFITLKESSHLSGKHVVVGRVIRGFDIVQKVAELDVDAKFRPLVPVTVSNSGELELRRPAPKPASDASASDPEEDRRSRKRRSRRSSSAGVSDEEEEKRKHKSKKSKKSKHKKRPEPSRARSRTPDKVDPSVPRQETEEEYDARLEREENERLEAQRREELRRVQERHATSESQSGVRFKGRGRMKYTDPESLRR